MRRLKIGVIGVGRRSRAHLPVISRMTDMYDFVAVCDVQANRAKQVAEEYHVKAYSNVERMLEKEELDVVDIVVPGEAHHVIAKVVAEHGTSMLVETPIGVTLPCIDLMIKAADKAGVKLEVAENVWRFVEERMKAEIIKSGVIGEVSRAYVINTWGAYHAMNAIRNYVGFAEARRVVGFEQHSPIKEIKGRWGRSFTVDDWTKGVIEFENGIIGVHEISFVGWWTRLLRTTRYTEVDGSEGCIINNDVHLVENGMDKVYTMRMITSKVNGIEVFEGMELDTEPKVVWKNPFKRYNIPADGPVSDRVAVTDELSSIGNAVLNDTEPSYGALNGRKDQELSIAIHESALNGNKVIKIPIETITSYEKRIHEQFKEKYGHDILEVDELIETFFGQR